MTKKNPPRRRARRERPTRSGKQLDRLLARMQARPIRSDKQIDRMLALLKDEVKACRISKTRARQMRRIAGLLRKVLTLERRAGGVIRLI